MMPIHEILPLQSTQVTRASNELHDKRRKTFFVESLLDEIEVILFYCYYLIVLFCSQITEYVNQALVQGVNG